MMVETFGSERFAFEEMFLIEKSFAALTGILLDELFDSFLEPKWSQKLISDRCDRQSWFDNNSRFEGCEMSSQSRIEFHLF